MAKAHEHRSDSLNFDLHYDEDGQEIYTDGVAQFLIGYPLTKVSFYSSQGNDPISGVEKRVVKAQISMTTIAWIDLANSILQNVKASAPAMEAGATAHSARLSEQLASIEQPK